MTTKKAKIQLGRAARQSTLESANPILLAGEPVIALDTGILKIGDGVSTYTQLPEIGASPDLSGYAQKAGDNTFSGDNNFTGDLQKNGVDVATTNDIPDISDLVSDTDYASTQDAGVVKVDGTTINIDNNGVISANTSTLTIRRWS